MRVFTVCSPHPADYASLERQILKFYEDEKHQAIIVKEYGKLGNHPHLNIIWTTELNAKYLPDFLKRTFKSKYSNHRLFKNKMVFNEDELVNGYLAKESLAQVLFNWQSSETLQRRKLSEFSRDFIEEVRQLIKSKKPPAARIDPVTGLNIFAKNKLMDVIRQTEKNNFLLKGIKPKHFPEICHEDIPIVATNETSETDGLRHL